MTDPINYLYTWLTNLLAGWGFSQIVNRFNYVSHWCSIDLYDGFID